MGTSACYPGSFDPPTLGHLDVIRRAAPVFDRLVVAVGVNPAKAPMLPVEERVALLRAELGGLGPRVEVESFRGLAVDFCRARGLAILVRGLRTVSDFESEFQMALTNRSLAPGIDTFFVMAGEKYSFVSSRLIKEILGAGAPVDAFVPPGVARALERVRVRGPG